MTVPSVERERFEAWAPTVMLAYPLDKDDAGRYRDQSARCAWAAWQAARLQTGAGVGVAAEALLDALLRATMGMVGVANAEDAAEAYYFAPKVRASWAEIRDAEAALRSALAGLKAPYIAWCERHRDCEKVPGPFCPACAMLREFQAGVANAIEAHDQGTCHRSARPDGKEAGS